MKNGPIDKSKLAKTDQEYRALAAGNADWIARTADDVRQLRQSGDCPLAKLPERDFQEFLASLEFKGGGVADGYYKPLMSSLSLTEIFEVFECFGMSREYFISSSDYSCSEYNCDNTPGAFCSHLCKRQ